MHADTYLRQQSLVGERESGLNESKKVIVIKINTWIEINLCLERLYKGFRFHSESFKRCFEIIQNFNDENVKSSLLFLFETENVRQQ
jgi:hypothetical protein